MTTSECADFAVSSVARAGGFQFTSGAAVKLFLALAARGRAGESTAAKIGAAAGIGERTVTGALAELRVRTAATE